MTADALKTAHICPVCGDATHLELLCKVDGLDIFTCATCSGEHVWPMPDAHALKAYYDRPEWFEGGEKGGYANYDAQTGWSVDMLGTVLAPFAGRKGLSILDVGCGYGTHLSAAAKAGWKCFGVEPSAHARKVAQERLGGDAFIVETVGDLIPHEFDVVLMLDVIEHLPSPYPTLYQLFSIGAITAKTLLVITTPNAGSRAAQDDPAGWPYRHPQSHLVYYNSEALTLLLRRLHFTFVDMVGLEAGGTTRDINAAQGLLVTAKDSDFTEFMRERYVPGTWSKLAEYEHLPRYALAKTLTAGKTVLDFGCGTGYGAALMADTAAHVTGLDIDGAAVEWATSNHRKPNLTFRRQDDLGASLPAKSFDLVTCFEMIEHVDFKMQQDTVANIARLLKDDGLFIISTPNPAVTALYGANPYHIREMNEDELRELLAPHFPHIKILRQFVRVGIAIDQNETVDKLIPGVVGAPSEQAAKPLAFLAVCSRKAVPDIADRILFDEEADYISQYMAKEETLNKVRLEAYLQGEMTQSLKGQLNRTIGERDAAQEDVRATTQVLDTRNRELMALEERRQQEKATADAAYAAKQGELDTLHRVRQDEHNSPRFLARTLWQATRARLRQKLSGRNQ